VNTAPHRVTAASEKVWMMLRDLVGGELRGVRAADVAVLVVAEQRVDAARVARRELGEAQHDLAAGVAVVLAQEVGPVLRIDVRTVDQIAREQHMGVAVVLDQRLLEDLHEALEIAQAALQVGAYEQPTVVG
jgi:hypothetical protein